MRAKTNRPKCRSPHPWLGSLVKKGFPFRQTLMLLEMQQQILAHRSAKKKDMLEAVDWRKFHEAVKDFLEDE